MNADGPIVGLQLQSRPQTLTIVRGMLSGVAELLEMDAELLDDIKTSVSEACNNVVLHAYGDEIGPMVIRLFVDDDAIRIVVQDEGVGIDGAPVSDHSHGIGVSVIQALSSEARFDDREGGGTEVSMRFDSVRDDHRLYTAPDVAASADDERLDLADGEVGLSLSPVSLLTGVLGRLARTLAATAHFSLDRFSDVYLITDTLAAHAGRSAESERITARLSAGERRLEVTLGPFRTGTAAVLQSNSTDPVGSPLAHLADEISVREWGTGEAIDVVVVDHRR